MKHRHHVLTSIKALILGLALFFAAYQSQAAEKTQVLEQLKLKDGDEKTNEVKSVQTEILVSKSEDLALKQVQKLLARYKSQPIVSDLLFRLAELKMRKAKSARFFEVHKKSNTVIRFAPTLVKSASSKKHILEAINTYETIEKKYPRSENIDAVVFNNGFARASIGQTTQAEAAYKRLLEKHSYSPLVPEAHLALGEMAFDLRKYDKSLKHFNAIKSYPSSPVFAYGLYKAAWSYYNLGQSEDAIRELEKVIDYGHKVAANKGDSRFDLRKEALNDLAVFYTDGRLSKSAVSYFIKQARDLDPIPHILNLAEIYERHSKYKDVVIVLNEFLDRLAEAEAVPNVYERLVNAYENMRDRTQAVNQLEKFAKICDDSSKWSKHMKSNKREVVLNDCKSTLKDSSFKLAQKWLRMWNTSNAYLGLADASERAFVVYLIFDDKKPEMAETRFTYAELLFKRKKFKAATDQYDLAADYLKDASKIHDSRYGAVIAFTQSVNDTFTNSSDEKKLFELSKKYLTYSPNGKFALDVEFKLGLIYYEKSHYKDASPIFVQLGDKYPNTEKGKKAQDLQLDILNSSKDYDKLKAYIKKVLPLEKQPSRLAKLNEIYQQTSFLQIQSLEENGKTEEALGEYKKFATSYSSSPLAEKAQWNSIQLLIKHQSFNLAAQASLDYAVMFSSTGKALEALKLSVQTFETIGRIDRAAEVTERLMVKEPTQVVKWGFLAADFYTLHGNESKATKVLNALLPQLKSQDQKIQYHEKMILALDKNATAQQKHFDELAKMGSKKHITLARNIEFEKVLVKNNSSLTFEEAKKVLNSSVEPWLKAKARFAQAEVLHKEFSSQSLNSSAERVAQVIALKLEKLDKAQIAYQQTIKFGETETSVKAMIGLSTLFAEYVRSLRNMRSPAGLAKDEVEVFREEINKLVLPIEEKGVETIVAAKELVKKTMYHGPLNDTLSHLWGEAQKSNDVYPSFNVQAPKVLFAAREGVL